MLIIIDYDTGNLGSIFNMLSRIGIKAIISKDLSDIESAEKLILAGVGSFDVGMEKLIEMNMVSLLNKKVLADKTPILGICLGMQLMTRNSQEGGMQGLGWFAANTERFKDKNINIPHMGWNSVETKKENILLREIGEKPRYYFMHSYHVVCDHDEDVLATTFYGYEFPSIINKNNLYGVQFHPEKSHKFGMQLLRNFANL